MTMRTATAACALAAAGGLLAGCWGPVPASPGAAGPASPRAPAASALVEPSAPVVVAVVDSGINPYHAAFRAPGLLEPPSRYLAGYPADARPLTLHLEARDYGDAVRADAATWDGGVAPRTLYWIPGTRVIGAISFIVPRPDAHPVLDDDFHGTAVASSVLAAAPGALLLVVEADAASLGEAAAWTASQPWVDVINLSWGTLANLPVGSAGLVNATRLAAERGALVVAAAGNEPTAQATDPMDGPPWVVSVGGADAAAHGETLVASKGADVVAPYVQRTAMHNSTRAWAVRSGTSFSAPLVAGALADAVQRVRAAVGAEGGRSGPFVRAGGPGALADGALTAAEVREALNRSAAYWIPLEWSPATPDPSAPPDARAALAYAARSSVPVGAAPWLQMGWGFVDPDTGARMASALLTGALPAKPFAAQVHMHALAAARCAAWCGGGPGRGDASR